VAANNLKAMVSRVAQKLPPELRLPLRGLLRDMASLPARLRDPERWNDPWQFIHNDGSTLDFRRSGDAIVAAMAQHADLRPDERVLDIGCGNGRIARALLGYLDENSDYTGFDIAPRAVEGCRRRYGQTERFRFVHADLFNTENNRKGKGAQRDFLFPGEAGSVTFAFAISVLTHMDIASIEGYARELDRVLAPGGRAFLTMFLLDDERRAAIAAGQSRLPFEPWTSESMVVDKAAVESAIAHDRRLVQRIFEASGFSMNVHAGAWCPPTETGEFQDIAVFRKA
jgi:SAM-dependent methyltransferase